MMIICAVLVSYMSSQKGEFVFLGSGNIITSVPNSFSIRRKHLLVILVHVLSQTMIYMTKVSKRNICQSFKGCRHTFEGYKLRFVYALIHTVCICSYHLSKWHYVINISAVKLYYVCILSVLLILYS